MEHLGILYYIAFVVDHQALCPKSRDLVHQIGEQLIGQTVQHTSSLGVETPQIVLNKKKHPNMAVGQNLVPLVNPKIAGKWMFIPLKMVLIGIDS